MNPLFDPESLLKRLGEPGLVVVDAQWRLGEPGAGERDWLDAHIPGAAHLDVEGALSAPAGPRGRHPLPEPETFAEAARSAGISNGSVVVAYDEAGGGNAARLWWLLRHFGHEEAYVLDGGLRAWRELGGPLRSGPEAIEPGDFTAAAPADDVVDADELLAGLGGGPTLLDARAPERWRGEHEPIDPVAGHIPGARNVPFAELSPDGRFLAREELRERLETEGEAVAYCGSGVSACNLVLAAEAAGLPRPRLYPGSWSEWSGRGLPVERG